jgi:predicted Na+-dependent transporter
MNEELKRRLTSRKLHVAIFVFFIATFFFWTGNLEGELWVDLVKWTAGLYMFGNGLEHLAKGGVTNNKNE